VDDGLVEGSRTLLDGGYAGWLDVDVWEHPVPFGASEKSKQALDAFMAER